MSIYLQSRMDFSFRPIATLEAKSVGSGAKAFHVYKEKGISLP